jgi:mannose/cellobiose epimerase-like protein (N-acyl-D-glucosamine 2-epimerase family)
MLPNLRCLLPALSLSLAAAVPGQRWLDHFNQDLLPFWNVPAAWGTPRGDFPTFRCNDGNLFSEASPCPEIQDAPGWIKACAGQEYTRMKSRQTYVYGVAYHLTGDPAMLALARDGVRFIREKALDKETGSAVSLWDKGVPGPPVLQRTSQDLAYAGVGLAVYYYLTRDLEVLADLARLKAHIFTKYWDPEAGLLKWVAEGPAQETARVELVAQLDQVNAYMLLVTPFLPEAMRKEWTADLLKLARAMVAKFHAPDRHLFWGTLHEPKALGTRHTDFGHTAKALWMIGRIARLAGDRELAAFVDREAPKVLDMARLPDGTWGSRLRRDGSVETYKEWWIYAELDQLAETLALSDRKWAKPLDATAAFWLDHMVDKRGHEVWGGVAGTGDVPSGQPKIHQWKSGYHSCEHALVGYLTSSALEGKAPALWFALPGKDAVVRPYVFEGRPGKIEWSPLPGFEGLSRARVAFTKIK